MIAFRSLSKKCRKVIQQTVLSRKSPARKTLPSLKIAVKPWWISPATGFPLMRWAQWARWVMQGMCFQKRGITIAMKINTVPAKWKMAMKTNRDWTKRTELTAYYLPSQRYLHQYIKYVNADLQVLGKHLQLWGTLRFVFYSMGWENNVQKIKPTEFQEVPWQHSNTSSYHHNKRERKQFGFFFSPLFPYLFIYSFTVRTVIP